MFKAVIHFKKTILATLLPLLSKASIPASTGNSKQTLQSCPKPTAQERLALHCCALKANALVRKRRLTPSKEKDAVHIGWPSMS